MKLNFPTNPISIKNGEYYIDVNETPSFHSMNAYTKASNSTIADYDISHEVDYNGYIGCSIVYLITGINYKDSSLYFKDVHKEELEKIQNDNSTTFECVLIYHNGNSKSSGQNFNIRQLFYWKMLGYDAIGIDFVNDKFMKRVRRVLWQEMRDFASDSIIFDKEFDKDFDKPSYEFAYKCENIMKGLGLLDLLTDEGIVLFKGFTVGRKIKIKIECVYRKQLHSNKHRKAKK